MQDLVSQTNQDLIDWISPKTPPALNEYRLKLNPNSKFLSHLYVI
jgi:hypothetical protein